MTIQIPMPTKAINYFRKLSKKQLLAVAGGFILGTALLIGGYSGFQQYNQNKAQKIAEAKRNETIQLNLKVQRIQYEYENGELSRIRVDATVINQTGRSVSIDSDTDVVLAYRSPTDNQVREIRPDVRDVSILDANMTKVRTYSYKFLYDKSFPTPLYLQLYSPQDQKNFNSKYTFEYGFKIDPPDDKAIVSSGADKEKASILKDIQNYLNGTEVKRISLALAPYSFTMPKGSEKFIITQTTKTSEYGETYQSDNRDKCLVIDAAGTITSKETLCRYETLSYEFWSPLRAHSMTGEIDVYINQFPPELSQRAYTSDDELIEPVIQTISTKLGDMQLVTVEDTSYTIMHIRNGQTLVIHNNLGRFLPLNFVPPNLTNYSEQVWVHILMSIEAK